MTREISDAPRSLREIERSIIKKYRKVLWARFVKAIKDYDLIAPGDRIAVCISGGKDSLLMAKLFQELRVHGIHNFELEFLAMDPGYLPDHRAQLEEHLDYLNIPARIVDSDIFAVTDEIADDYPCYMCARMRRGFLYATAAEWGCNVISLGHHFNDVIETTLLNVLYAGCFQTMIPKLPAKNFPGLSLIRPLYHLREEDILQWTRYAGLKPLDCACSVAAKKTASARENVKELITSLKESIPQVDLSIFRSAQNVNADMILGWREGENVHDFHRIYQRLVQRRDASHGYPDRHSQSTRS